ncbi:MAG: archaeal proteasome endopeptidase complex subunit alpha [Candidatus Aenigmarchaeota archaeon]|nr:archaeal proteasome endopeptidase complex subunit alpha [Candidatus Aenigmarchaeota archaeon]
MAYDRTIVVFSPDGRLLQVEYARQMVKNGTTSIGLKTRDAVILGTVKMAMPLAVVESYKKINKIDDHAAAVSSGSLADARELVELARIRAQINRITYGEPISVKTLATFVCDRKHLVTQYAGVRPYGVGMLIAGCDESGSRLYETDPSGTMIEWYAQAIGRGAAKAKAAFDSGYKGDMETKAGIKMLVKALKKCEKDAEPETMEIAVIDSSGVKVLDRKEIAQYI